MKPNLNTELKSIENEIWIPCPGYEGYYEISTFGRVKSLYRVITTKRGNEHTINPRILKQELKNKSKGKKSYARVCLLKDGIQFKIAIHKLMLRAGIKLKTVGSSQRYALISEK